MIKMWSLRDKNDNSLLLRWSKLYKLILEVINKIVIGKDACSLLATSLKNIFQSTQLLIKNSNSGYVSEIRCLSKVSNKLNFDKLLQVKAKRYRKILKGENEKSTNRTKYGHKFERLDDHTIKKIVHY